MVDENKVRVYAPIDVQPEIEQAAWEKAEMLAFPEEKQGDLQYIRSILVSAGTNKNGAHFLPSEMMMAHSTIVNKAIDIEHDESKVIGHIYEAAFLFKDGEQFDPTKILAEYEELSNNPDTLDIDICVAGVIHKMRFPELADEISAGEWKVSMECYFKDFDIKIGDTIITRDEAKALGYDPNDLVGGFVKIMAGQKALGKQFVSRVLRHITFSGMGVVKNPANPHSIIMETAEHREQMERGERVIDLEHIDNLRGHKVELSSTKEEVVEETTEETTTAAVKVVSEEGDVMVENPVYIEVDNETGGIKRILSVEDKEDAAARWSGNGLGGPGSVDSWPDSVCKSFKKRVTKFNALDQSEGQVVHEHWCALFEEPCPVIGATAKAPECLRNQKNRTVKDPRDNTLTKTIDEHIQQGPGNTFVTVLPEPILSTDVMAVKQERGAQIARIREGAQELRNSLRSFVAAEKKTSE
jgi:hypothetical protein